MVTLSPAPLVCGVDATVTLKLRSIEQSGRRTHPLPSGSRDDVLSVLPHKEEDTWDRCASVLGFWAWTGIGSTRSSGRPTGHEVDSGSGSSGEASVATNVLAVGDRPGGCAI